MKLEALQLKISFQYPQTKICFRGKNVSIFPSCMLLLWISIHAQKINFILSTHSWGIVLSALLKCDCSRASWALNQNVELSKRWILRWQIKHHDNSFSVYTIFEKTKWQNFQKQIQNVLYWGAFGENMIKSNSLEKLDHQFLDLK